MTALVIDRHQEARPNRRDPLAKPIGERLPRLQRADGAPQRAADRTGQNQRPPIIQPDHGLGGSVDLGLDRTERAELIAFDMPRVEPSRKRRRSHNQQGYVASTMAAERCRGQV